MSNQRRRIVMSITVCICMVYLVYRGIFTLNLDNAFAAVFSITLYVAEIYGNLLMFLYFFQIWNPILPDPVPPLENAKVDAYIPTYDEDPELLRGTIEAALAMDYPHDTYILDDGARPEVKALCDELGAKYVKRDSNIHAKAGNLNHAMEITDGDFIIVFDSDHIAERHFITRTLGYFADEKLAFVQTPHSYYNFDSFQGSLDYEKKLYWEEGQLFYNIVQPGKNHWNSASFCGSAAIFRKASLEDVGLIATESITEDMQTGLRLHSRGWKSMYINERLVSGLAAPDLKTFTVQRLRWGEGNLGTIFYDNPFTMEGLSFAQRLNYIALMFSWTTGVQKLILYVTPLLMLLSGVGPVADMSWHLVLITAVYVISIWYTVKASGNGYGRLIDTEITQMASFWTQCRGTWRAIFNRKNATFVVTKKSGGGGKTSGIHEFLKPQYTYIAASVVCITWAAARYVLGVSEDFLGLSICSFLVGMHCLFAWIVIRRALAQRRFEWRHPVAAHIEYELKTVDGVQRGVGFTKDLSELGASFIAYDKLGGYQLKMTITAGDRVVTLTGSVKSRKRIADVLSKREGDIRAYRYGVEFDSLENEQKKTLWHICTKYAVARRYHDFNPNLDEALLAPVTEEGDKSMLLPARIYRPDTGDIHAVVESVTNNAFSLLTDKPLTDKDLFRAKVTTSGGDICGNVRKVKTVKIDLAQMPMWAHRFQFDAFDNQSRGMLTTLLHLSGEKQMREIASLTPEKTSMPLAMPAVVVGTISALAAALTICATLFLCQDEVLMARAVLNKPIDDSGRGRLMEMVKLYEKEPDTNERHFLRLRDAMAALDDERSLARLNKTLITKEFRLPAARLQRAYALEKMGRSEEARDAFDVLIENIEIFRNNDTQANLLLAAARNAANIGDYDQSVRLYKLVYIGSKKRHEIRSEFAGILTAAGLHSEARTVLVSEELTREDRFLLGSIHTSLKEFDKAHSVYVQLAEEDPTLRARRCVARIDAWSERYKKAIESYKEILLEYPDDLETRIALTQALVWDEKYRPALSFGEKLLPEVTEEIELELWVPLLEAIAKLSYVEQEDQVLAMKLFGQRADHESNEPFAASLARALDHAFEPDQSAPLVEQLLHSQPESIELQTVFARILYGMGEVNAAAEHYEAMLSNKSLPKDPRKRGELLLAAALNSRRRGALNEAAQRYDSALQCFLLLIKKDYQDTDVWMPFLNAVAGAENHSAEVEKAVLEVFNARAINEDRPTAMRLSDALSRIRQDVFALQVLDEIVRPDVKPSRASFSDEPGLESTAELTPDSLDTEIHWRRANVLLRLDRNVEAEAVYKALLAGHAFRDDRELYVSLLLAAASNVVLLDDQATAQDRYSSALDLLRDQFEKDPEKTSLWVPFLSAIAGHGKISQRDLGLVLDINEKRDRLFESTEFLARLNDVLLVGEQTELALPLLKTLTERRPKSRSIRYRYAMALQNTGQLRDAEKQYQFLLDEQKRSPDQQSKVRKSADDDVSLEVVMIGAAQNAASLGDKELAIRLSSLALVKLRRQVDHDIDETKYWLPYLSALTGCDTTTPTDDDLVLEIHSFRDTHPNSPAFVTNLSQALTRIGRSAMAVELAKEGILRFRDNRELQALVARSLTSVGDHTQAARYFAALLKQTETHQDLAFRGRILVEAANNSRVRGAYDEANERSSKALSLLSQQLTSAPKDESLWQPYLDAASSTNPLPTASRRHVLTMFKEWNKHTDNVQFIERLSDVLIKSGYARRALPLLEHIEDRSENAKIRLATVLSDIGEYAQAEIRIHTILSTISFVGEPTRAIDVYLVAANNAAKLGESDLAKERYASALRIIRSQLVAQPNNVILLARFLDALAGSESVEPQDRRQVEFIEQHWEEIEDLDFRARLVDVLVKLERPEDALPILESLEKNASATPSDRLRLATILQSLNRFEEAETKFQELLDTPGLHTKQRLSLLAAAARNSMGREDFHQARARFESLFASGESSKGYEIEYAITLRETGQLNTAIELLGRAERSADNLQLLASMFMTLKDYAKAKAAYAEVLRDDPTNESATRNYAFVLLWNKDYTEAITRFGELLSSSPSDVKLQEGLASAYLWSGDAAKAINHFAELLEIDDTRDDWSLSFLQAAAGTDSLTDLQNGLVEEIANRILSSTDGAMSDEILEQLADVFAAQKKSESSLEIYRGLIARHPRRTELRTKYALALMATGQTAEAIPYLEQLVRENSKAASIRLQLAYGYLRGDEFKKADEQFAQLIHDDSIADLRTHAEMTLAAASASQNNKDQATAQDRYSMALSEFSNLTSSDPQDTTIWTPFLSAAAGATKWLKGTDLLVESIYERKAEHPRSDEFLLRLADVWSRMKRPSIVLELLGAVTITNENRDNIEGRIADAHMELEQYKQAIATLRKLVGRAPGDWKRQKQLGDALYATNQYVAATKVYSGLLDTELAEVHRVGVLLQAARTSFAAGNLSLAVEHFEERRTLMSGRDEVDTEYAGVLLQMGRVERAIELLRTRPKLKLAEQLMLAGAYEAAKKTELANSLYSRLSLHEPSKRLKGAAKSSVDIQDKARRGLARTALELKDYATAITQFEWLVQEHDEPALRLGLASALLGAEDFPAAIEQLTKLVNEDPKEQDYWLPFIQAVSGIEQVNATHLTQVDEIRKSVRKAQLSSEQLTEFNARFADIYLNAERFEDVLSVTDYYVQNTEEVAPLEIAKRRAFALVGANRPLEAQPIYQRWLKVEPNNRDARYLFALGLQKSGKHDEAAEHFENLLATTVSEPAPELLLAAAENLRSLSTAKNEARADELSRRAMKELLRQYKSDPNDTKVWTSIARAINASSDPGPLERSTLVEISHAALELDANESVTEQLASALIKSESWAEAKSMLERSISLDPKNDVSRVNLAVSLVQLGEYEKAQPHFDTVINRNNSPSLATKSATERRQLEIERCNLLLASGSNLVRLARHPESLPLFDEALSRLGRLLTIDPAGLPLWQPFLDAAAGADVIPASYELFVQGMFEKRTLKSDSSEFRERMSDVMIRLGYFERTVEMLESVPPKDDGVRYRLAIALTNLERDQEARVYLDRLVTEKAFSDEKQRRAELWLVAASNSGRRVAMDEMAERYQQALPLWRELFHEQNDNARLWPRYLDAAAGTRKLDRVDVPVTLEIFDRFDAYEFLTEDLAFMTRLIDVMIRIEEPAKVLPVTRSVFAANEDDIEIRLRLANNLHAVGRFEEADIHYDYLMEHEAFADDEQTRSQMMVTSARNNSSMGNFHEARRIFEYVWQLGFKNRDYEIEYAVVLMKTGSESEAKRILVKEPLKLDQKYRLASMYTSAQELEAADKVYEQILAIQPDDVIAQRRRAELLGWLKRYAKATSILNALLLETPNDEGLLLMLAKTKLWSGHPNEALRMLRPLLLKKPDDRDLYFAYLEAVGVAKPLQAIDRKLIQDLREKYNGVGPDDIQPTRSEFAIALGRPLVRIGEHIDAIELLRAALSADPASHPARQKLADVFMQSKQYGPAIEHYQRLLRQQPESNEFRMQLGYAHHELGQFQEARRYFDLLVNDTAWIKASGATNYSFILAAASNSQRVAKLDEATGRYKLAFELLKSRNQQDPSDSLWLPMLHAASGISLNEATELKSVAGVANQLFENRDKYTISEANEKRATWIALSRLLTKLNRSKRAQTLLREMIEADGNDVEARFMTANISQAHGELGDSLQQFEIAVRRLELLDKSRFEPLQLAEFWLSAADAFEIVEQEERATEMASHSLEALSKLFSSGPTDNPAAWLCYVRATNIVRLDAIDARTMIDRIYDLDWRSTGDEFLWSELAEALLRFGRNDEAMELVSLLPEDNELRYWRLAEAAMNSGQHEEALAYYQSLLDRAFFDSRDTRYLDVQLAMANLRRLEGNNKESQRLFNAVALHYRPIVFGESPTDGAVRSYLSALAGLDTLHADDEAWLESMVRKSLSGNNLERIRLIAELMLKSENDGLADLFFTKVAGLKDELYRQDDPAVASLQFAHAKYLVSRGENRTALPMLETLAEDKIFTSNPLHRRELTLVRARIHMAEGEFESAKTLFGKVDSRFISTAELALVAGRTGDVDRAIELLEGIASPLRTDLALLASFHLDKGNFDAARTIYEQMLAESPSDLEAQRWLADVYFWARNYDEAIQRYETLMKLSPDDRDLRESYGKSLLWIGRYEDAIPVLRKLAEEQPNRTSLWAALLDAMAGSETVSLQDPLFTHIDKNFATLDNAGEIAERLARIYLANHEPNLALSRIEPYVGEVDATIGMNLQYADVLSQLSRPERAIAIYLQQLDDLPEDVDESKMVEYRLRFGDVLHRAKNLAEAQVEFDWVLKRVKPSTPARYRHVLLSSARNLVGLKRLPDALRQFEQLRKLDPETFDIYEEYGGALLASGQPRKALVWIRQSPSLSLEGRYLLGAIYANLKEFHSASEVYRKIIRAEPKEWRAYRELAEVSTWGKDFRTAIHVYKNLLKRSPNSEPLQIGLANAYLWSEQYQLALDEFTSILNKNPNQYDLWVSLVHSASVEGVVVSRNSQALLEHVARQRANWPADLEFRRSMMEAMFRVGRSADGLFLLRQIVDADPTSHSYRRRLADELHNLKRYDEAERHYQILLKERSVKEREELPEIPHRKVRPQFAAPQKVEPRRSVSRYISTGVE